MTYDTASLYNQSDKILNVTIFQRNLLDFAFAERQTFSLFSRIIFSVNRSLGMNLLDLPNRLIKQ